MKTEKAYQLKVYAVQGTPITALINALVTAAGGVTTTEGKGWWKLASGQVVNEPVTIVEVACSQAEAAAVAAAVDAYIGACINGGQEAVAVFTDGEECQPVFALYYEVPA